MLRELSEEFRKFGSFVVQESRANLTKEGKGNGALFNSLSYELSEPFKDVYDVSFSAVDYANFIDKGVKGADPNLVKNGKQKAAGSPYSYRSKMPPMLDIRAWAKQKNIRLRDKKGRFEKGNYNTIAFILQRRIFAQGIAPTMFFTKPFLKGVEIYTPLLQAALGRDVDELIRINVALQKTKK